MSRTTAFRSLRLPTAGVLSLLAMCGCGGDGPLGGQVELAEASGTVTLQGSPLAGATVQAIPKSGPLATGITDAQGNFTLSTGANKGVAVGPIKVAVRPATPAGASNPATGYDPTNPQSVQDAMRKYQEQRGSSPTPPKAEETGIPAIYLNADTSGIKFDIKAGESNQLKIDLK